jgi:hypothetical protein
LEEQQSLVTTTQAIVDLLNALYGAGLYARGTLDAFLDLSLARLGGIVSVL